MILIGARVSRGTEPPPPPADAAPPWNPAAFNALDPAAKVAFVRSALAWREAKLNNFSYELSEIVQNVDAKTREVQKQMGAERHYGLHRLGEKYLVTGIADSGYAGDVPRRFWARWDGAVYRSFTEAGHKNKASGSIRSEEHEILFYVEYNQMLGLREYGVYLPSRSNGVHSKPLTLVQWLDHFVASGKEATPRATLEKDDDGADWIELRVQSDQYRTYLYVLDPTRQYLPTRYSSVYRTGKFEHGGQIVATQAQQVAGFWVPQRVVFTVKHATEPGQEQERIYTTSHFALGDVKENDLKVDFGRGAEVVDVTTHTAYHLDADKKPTAQPLADVKTAKAYTATEQELADVLRVNPIEDDISDAAITSRKARLKEYADRLEVRRHADDPVWKKPAPTLPAGAVWHNSEPLTWESLKGKYVIVHFSAEWCAPCKNDYPMLTRLHENDKSKRLAVVGLHVTGSQPEKVNKLLQEYKLTYPICEDVPPAEAPGPNVNGWGKTFSAYGVSAIPHAILVGPDGRVLERGTLMDVYYTAIEAMSKDAVKSK
jgi:thiol-disulfide isomerase/thioredoxin